jgi:hypothetical protein
MKKLFSLIASLALLASPAYAATQSIKCAPDVNCLLISSGTPATNATLQSGTYTLATQALSETLSSKAISLISGTATTPSLYFNSATSTGLSQRNGNTLVMSAQGVKALELYTYGSGVNYWGMQGAGTGVSPKLSVQGSDTDIGLEIVNKGTGTTQFLNNGAAQFIVGATATAVNRLTAAGAATGTAPTITASGSDSTIGITLAPKGGGIVSITGTGGLYVQPDGSTSSPSIQMANATSGISYNSGSSSIRFSQLGVESLRLNYYASGVNYLALQPGATGINPSLTASGTDSNIGLQFNGKGTGNVTFSNNSASQFIIGATATAVNRITVAGGAAGSNPTLTVTGSDATVGMTIAPKGGGQLLITGTGGLKVNADGDITTNAIAMGNAGIWHNSGSNTTNFQQNGVQSLQLQYYATGVNYVAIQPGATGVSPTIRAAGADSNINLSLAPTGTGKVVFSSGYNTGTITSDSTGVLSSTATLPVVRGGTGANTLTGYVKGNGTSAMTAGSASLYTAITATGTSTYTPQSYSTVFQVTCYGGAGGGGGGPAYTAGTSQSGGGAGGGGNKQEAWFTSSQISGAQTVFIGAGGAGGAGAASLGNAGSNGVAGANTTFGSLLTAYAGGFGAGGASGNYGGGGGGAGLAGSGGNGGVGSAGAAGFVGGAAGGSTSGGTVNATAGAGGGGGGGIVAGGVGQTGGATYQGGGGSGGGSGGGVDSSNTAYAGGLSGIVGGTSIGGTAGTAGTNGGNGSNSTFAAWASGRGGSGGGSGSTGTGGNGGDGAQNGGGGGGGGAARTAPGGNGGKGGDGACYVREW